MSDYKQIEPSSKWGKTESNTLHNILDGLKKGHDFAHGLAKEMGFTEYVHADKSGEHYFEVMPGSKDPLNKLEDMSFDDKENKSFPVVGQVAFMVPILGLTDENDVSIILDNMLSDHLVPDRTNR